MTTELQHLIAQARSLANDHPCISSGHLWESEGGRRCPEAADDDDGCGGSQAVYRCARCGLHDYGEPGGPGHADCEGGCNPVQPRVRHCPPPLGRAFTGSKP